MSELILHSSLKMASKVSLLFSKDTCLVCWQFFTDHYFFSGVAGNKVFKAGYKVLNALVLVQGC